MFITGAARGIGRGAAIFMTQRGANVILHGRTKDDGSPGEGAVTG